MRGDYHWQHDQLNEGLQKLDRETREKDYYDDEELNLEPAPIIEPSSPEPALHTITLYIIEDGAYAEVYYKKELLRVVSWSDRVEDVVKAHGFTQHGRRNNIYLSFDGSKEIIEGVLEKI